jgi:hypothetical protein
MKIQVIGIALLFVTASATNAAEADYLGVSKSSPPAEVALLRGISNMTRKHILSFSSGFAASIVSVTVEGQANPSLKRKPFGTIGDVYVKPGIYVVRVECNGAGFWITRDFPQISAEPGYAYLLECYGTTAHNMRTRINRQLIAEMDKDDEPQAASPK